MATKSELEIRFQNGNRPSQTDFKEIFDSYVHKEEDGLSVDDDGNVVFNSGIRLSDNEFGELGALRFHNNQVEFFNGDWVPIASGSGGAFQPIDSGTAVTYAAGNVGVGAFATAPTYRLEVNIGRNTGEAERVRFGNVVCSNGPTLGTAGYAYFYNQSVSDNINAAYALRQSADGNVHLNAPNGVPVSIRQNGTTVRLGVTASGNVVIGGETDLVAEPYVFQVAGSAFKNDGEGAWNVLSDARVKEDVSNLDVGLEELMRVRPVRYRYNGKAGTRRGKNGIGIIGQEMEKIFPEMIHQVAAGEEFEEENLRVYNDSALTYVLVNAVKQLAEQVRELQQELVEAKNSAEREPV